MQMCLPRETRHVREAVASPTGAAPYEALRTFIIQTDVAHLALRLFQAFFHRERRRVHHSLVGLGDLIFISIGRQLLDARVQQMPPQRSRHRPDVVEVQRTIPSHKVLDGLGRIRTVHRRRRRHRQRPFLGRERHHRPPLEHALHARRDLEVVVAVRPHGFQELGELSRVGFLDRRRRRRPRPRRRRRRRMRPATSRRSGPIPAPFG